MYTLGLDIGSSAVKVSVLEVETGRCAGTAACPDHEMEISAPHPGWAEQAPQEWWKNAVLAIRQVMKENDIRPDAGEEAGGSLEELPETDEAPKAGNTRRGRK